jgi:hypothetical protein
MSDIPITVSKQFQYADDIALNFQANSFAECETTLEADLEKLDEFFRRWRILRFSPEHTRSKQTVGREIYRHRDSTCGTLQIPWCNLRSYIDVQRPADENVEES